MPFFGHGPTFKQGLRPFSQRARISSNPRSVAVDAANQFDPRSVDTCPTCRRVGMRHIETARDIDAALSARPVDRIVGGTCRRSWAEKIPERYLKAIPLVRPQ